MKLLKIVFVWTWVVPLLAVGWAIGLAFIPIAAGVAMIAQHFYVEENDDEAED